MGTTTLYRLMPQSRYQQAALSLVNKLLKNFRQEMVEKSHDYHDATIKRKVGVSQSLRFVGRFFNKLCFRDGLCGRDGALRF